MAVDQDVEEDSEYRPAREVSEWEARPRPLRPQPRVEPAESEAPDQGPVQVEIQRNARDAEGQGAVAPEAQTGDDQIQEDPGAELHPRRHDSGRQLPGARAKLGVAEGPVA